MEEIKAEADPVRIRKRRSRRTYAKRKTSFWLLIILLITFILSAFMMNIPPLIDKYLNFTETPHRPVDAERISHEKEHQTFPAKTDGFRNR